MHEKIASFIPDSYALNPEGVENFIKFTPEECLKIGPSIISQFKSDVVRSNPLIDLIMENNPELALDPTSEKGIKLAQVELGDLRCDVIFVKRLTSIGIKNKLSVISRKLIPDTGILTNYSKVSSVTVQYRDDSLTPVYFMFESEIPSHINTASCVGEIENIGSKIKKAPDEAYRISVF